MCPISSRQGNRSNILDLKEPRNFLEDNDEDYLELLRSLSSSDSTSNFDLHGIGESCDFNGHYRGSVVTNNSAAVLSLDSDNNGSAILPPAVPSSMNKVSNPTYRDIERRSMKNRNFASPHFDSACLREGPFTPVFITAKKNACIGIHQALEGSRSSSTNKSIDCRQADHRNLRRKLSDNPPQNTACQSTASNEDLKHDKSHIRQDTNNEIAFRLYNTILASNETSNSNRFTPVVNTSSILQSCNNIHKKNQYQANPPNCNSTCTIDQQDLHQKIYVDTINDNDVLFGRGGKINSHPGNQNYLNHITYVQPNHHKSCKHRKTQISHEIVQWVNARGGRFLEKDSGTGKYFVVAHERARRKAAQALSEFKRARSHG